MKSACESVHSVQTTFPSRMQCLGQMGQIFTAGLNYGAKITLQGLLIARIVLVIVDETLYPAYCFTSAVAFIFL